MFFELIVGMLLGVLIGKVICHGEKRGGVTHGPNSKDIVGQVFEVKGKYYKFTPSICPCPLLFG